MNFKINEKQFHKAINLQIIISLIAFVITCMIVQLDLIYPIIILVFQIVQGFVYIFAFKNISKRSKFLVFLLFPIALTIGWLVCFFSMGAIFYNSSPNWIVLTFVFYLYIIQFSIIKIYNVKFNYILFLSNGLIATVSIIIISLNFTNYLVDISICFLCNLITTIPIILNLCIEE